MKRQQMDQCPICSVNPRGSGLGMCIECKRSYDQRIVTDDGSIWSVAIWAAARARAATKKGSR